MSESFESWLRRLQSPSTSPNAPSNPFPGSVRTWSVDTNSDDTAHTATSRILPPSRSPENSQDNTETDTSPQVWYSRPLSEPVSLALTSNTSNASVSNGFAQEPTKELLMVALDILNARAWTNISMDGMMLVILLIYARYVSRVSLSAILGFKTDPGTGIDLSQNQSFTPRKGHYVAWELEAALRRANLYIKDCNLKIREIAVVLAFVNLVYRTDIGPVEILGFYCDWMHQLEFKLFPVNFRGMPPLPPPARLWVALPVAPSLPIDPGPSNPETDMRPNTRQSHRRKGAVIEDLGRDLPHNASTESPAVDEKEPKRYSLKDIKEVLKSMERSGAITSKNNEDIMSHLNQM